MTGGRSTDTTKHTDAVWPFQGEHEGVSARNSDPLIPKNLTAVSLNQNNRRNQEPRSPWLRPFFSLRAQLLFAYSLILATIILAASLLEYMQLSRLYIVLVVAIMVLVGFILSYLLTTWLLRPLWRVVDASQAIAAGDLAQRERLVPHQPPQDDIDRLAGSLDIMVSQLERAERLQYASEQRFKQFFSDASHQLRTPLTSIRGFTEILMRGAINDSNSRQHVLERIKSESERMTRLINDLLTLSRLDNSHPPRRQYIDMIELANEAIAQAIARTRDDRTIRLELVTMERLGLKADEEQIKQLLFILIDNALKHGRQTPDGEVILRLDKQSEQIVIKVIDNGEGIDQGDLQHIFESFYRGRPRHMADSSKNNNKSSTGGAGLGLTIAQAIVRAHSGSISAYSEPGKGTAITILFPSA
jgi:signal transduction histidine kinase